VLKVENGKLVGLFTYLFVGQVPYKGFLGRKKTIFTMSPQKHEK